MINDQVNLWTIKYIHLITIEVIQWFKSSYTLIMERGSKCTSFSTLKNVQACLIQLSNLTDTETKAKIYKATTC